MQSRGFAAVTSLLFAYTVARAAPVHAEPAHAEPPIQVMILGVYHLANPGHDIHNIKVDDVTTPRRQAELAELAARLEQFKPTRVAVEAMVKTPELTYTPYHDYKPSDLANKRNEITQIGFRIAHDVGLAEVHGIDEDSDTIDYFPYGKLQAYIEHAGGATKAQFAALNQQMETQVAAFAALQRKQSIAALLAGMNEPARIRADNAFYFEILKLGDATVQAGAELNGGWYLRNAKIFAKLTQIARPGDRVIVVFGAGHAFWLRHFVENTPGYQLVEPNRYLAGQKP